MRRLPENFHLQLYSTSPAPKRDYHGLTITNKHIILNSWDISRGPHVFPRRKKTLLEDFPTDRWFMNEIEFLFGSHVVEYAVRLATGERNLQYLPETLVLYIVRMLAVNDILHLRQLSKIFFEICNTNSIWKIIFRKYTRRPITKTDLKQSEVMSWKYMLQRKFLEKMDSKTVFESFKRGLIPKYDQDMLEKVKFKSRTLPVENLKKTTTKKNVASTGHVINSSQTTSIKKI